MLDSQQYVRDIEEFAQNIVDTVREPLLILDMDLRVQSANRAFYRMFQVSAEETMGCLVDELGDGQWDIPALRTLLEQVIPADSTFDDFEVTHEFAGVGRKTMLLNARKVYRPGNHMGLLILAMEDVTERRAAEEKLRAAQEKLQADYERERRVALALQRPLMLEIAEDAFPGLSVASMYSSAWADRGEAVGGDFFDAFALADGRVALVLGDASGKGLTAAARATEVKDVLRAFLRVYPHYPAVTLSRLNDYLCDTQSLDHRSPDQFMALALALINPRRSEVAFAWAGIESPLVARVGGSVEAVSGGGLPLGVSAQEVYVETTVNFRPGDTLMMITDGLSEARRGKSLLGPEGVMDLVRAARSEPSAKAMGQAVLSGAQAYAGGQLQDDACLILARRR